MIRGADLSKAILREASLYATILIDSDLSGADLTKARIIAAMTGVKLVGATLRNADFGADPGNQPIGVIKTDLGDADLSGADLGSANLRKVELVRTNLSGADLTDADLTGANLSGAVMRAVRGKDRIKGLDRARNVDKAIFQ